MIDLPSADVDDVARLADWVELCVSVADEGSVSQAQVSDVLRDAAFAGIGRSDSFAGESAELYDETISDEDSAERLAQTIWDELRTRSVVLGDGYPVEVSHAEARLRHGTWREVPAFEMLLILDIIRFYPRGWITPDGQLTRLFEKIVEAAKQTFLHGPCSRFGWPIEPGWPTAVSDRVARLAEELGLSVGLVREGTLPEENDKGLDVAGLVGIAGSSAGTIAILTQCAAGKNWREKTGEPSIDDWHDVLQWNAQLIKGVAVPWRLEGNWDVRRVQRKFRAIVLDRPRLTALEPDAQIDDTLKSELIAWCEPQITSLPTLN